MRYPSLILVATWILSSGCHSRTASQAKFHPTSQVAGSDRQLRVNVAVVGANKPDEQLGASLSRLAEKARACPPERRALIAADCGIVAMHAGDIETAREMLDEAVGIVSGVLVGGDRERAATKLNQSESVKVFKGEPYERAMIYFYRGLLYLADGDPENAHACFLNAALQDAQARDDSSRADWLAVDALTLLCKRRIGDPSAGDFERWLRSRYSGELAGADGLLHRFEEPVIFVLGVGRGPTKETLHDRRGRVSLAYREHASRVCAIRISHADNTQQLTMTDNVYVQAVSRGRRSMDGILTRKSSARHGTEALGTTMLTVGSIGGGLIGQLVGTLIFEASMEKAGKIDSSADVRALHTLPGYVYLGIMEHRTLPEVVKIEVFGEDEKTIGWASAKLAACGPGSSVLLGLLPY